MTSVYDDLFSAVRSSLEACAYKRDGQLGSDQEMDEEVDFWLDPETVIFETSPLEEDIYAATYDSLKNGREKLSELVSEELISTYLSTRDFSVIFAVDDTDDQETILVAAVDRSTGIAMLKVDNLIDEKALDEASKIATGNVGSTKLSPFNYNYRLVKERGDALSEVQQANSQRRLTALLSEIDLHVLSRYVGAEVQVRDDL
jgi:hypothetical protein